MTWHHQQQQQQQQRGSSTHNILRELKKQRSKADGLSTWQSSGM
jgi:hypothetical protein